MQREMVRIISGGRESGNLQQYLSANPLIDSGFHAGSNVWVWKYASRIGRPRMR